MIKLGFYGAAGGVTGSNFLVETDSRRYIVDCGLFQGRDARLEENYRSFGYEPRTIQAVVITHAHLDHVGRLPKLVAEGYRGPIYATEPTIELAILALKDALGVMEDRDRRQDQPLLYSHEDLNRTIDSFQPVEYRQPINLIGGDQLTMFDAGHILGSASVMIEVEGRKLVFSGDIGHYPGTLLPAPQPPSGADWLVMEATYGDREHQEKDRLAILKEAIDWTVANQGVLLIPAFAIERTQELLYLLHHMSQTKQIPDIPIYLDSPLGIEVLEVFERFGNYFAPTVKSEFRRDRGVFSLRRLVLTPTVEGSKDINDCPPPKIIIAGSGMMEGGRIHHHLKRYISSPKTYLLVIGFQAPGTTGSYLLTRPESLTLDDRHFPVRAKIEAVDVFSSHADNSQLIDWAKAIKLPPKTRSDPGSGGQVFLVHSDPQQAAAFAEHLATQLPNNIVEVAKLDQTVELS